MSLNFDGLDDVIKRFSTATLGAIITVSAWVKLDDFGENQSGAIWQQGDQADGARLAFRVLDNKLGVLAKGFGFGSARATQQGRWASDDNVLMPGEWRCLAVTYDGTLTANNPQFYRDGVPITTNRALAPSGAMIADNETIYIGNNFGTTRSYDGLIGEVCVWKRLLLAAEVAAVCHLGVNAVPDYFDYTPFDFGCNQTFGSGGGAYVGSGPVFADNPPIRPCGRRG